MWMSRINALINEISKLQQKLDKQIETEAINKECVLRLSQDLDKLITEYLKHKIDQ